MREIPILYNDEMVAAHLEDRKNNTRRLQGLKEVNQCPDEYQLSGYGITADVNQCLTAIFSHGESVTFVKSPYGSPLDLLWVKETHYMYGRWVTVGTTKTGKVKKEFVRDTSYSVFFTPHNKEGHELEVRTAKDGLLGWYKRPSLFMPKDVARLWLKVKEVHVERLQDISEGDAMAEGIESSYSLTRNPATQYKNYYPANKGGLGFVHAKWSFKSLWQSINGPASWKANPWVLGSKV